MAADGRWVVYGNVAPSLLRETAQLVERFYGRLDEVLGGPACGQGARAPGAVLLALVSSEPDVAVILESLGREFPHLAEWSKAMSGYPRLQTYAPLLAVVRHDQAVSDVKHPEVQLAHTAVQLELTRRFGRLPFWLGEALGYALQDELVGGVYGYSYRNYAVLDENYHQGWKRSAQQALGAAPVRIAELAQDSGRKFDQERAYRQFGVASWWLRERAEKLRELFGRLAEQRRPQAPDQEYEPEAAEQAALFEEVFGPGMAEEAAGYWKTVQVGEEPDATSGAVASALTETIQRHELKAWNDAAAGVRLYSDFPESTSKEILKTSTALLQQLGKILGKSKDAASYTVVALRRPDAYQQLCDALAAADPSAAAYLQRNKRSSGFLLSRHRLTVYFQDATLDIEESAAHSLGHNLVHMELERRCGTLPLWLAEGLSYALQEGVTGEVWAYWHRNEFVFSASHSAWRAEAARLLAPSDREPGGGVDLRDLYTYSADPYQDDLAHAAYGFVVYGLEKDRKGFARFLDLLEEERDKKWMGIGGYAPQPDVIESLAKSAFGGDLEKRLRAFWAEPPKRGK